MTPGEVALITSGCALAISISGFVWSICKEFVFVKPRVQISFNVTDVLGGASKVKLVCTLNATNMGPGPVHLYCCIFRGRRGRFGMLNPIDGSPTSLPHREAGPFAGGLPLYDLAPGRSKTFYFPYAADCFLKDPIVRVGVQDTYGRNYWCRRKFVALARNRYRSDFQGKT